MMSILGKQRRSVRAGVFSGLLTLAMAQTAAADAIIACVDPDFGNEGESGGAPPRDDDDGALFQLEGMDIWLGTPWDPEFFGFPEWFFPNGPSGEPDDDDPGGDGPSGDGPSDDAPFDPGYTGTSYEGELTWDEPECKAFAETLLHDPENLQLSGNTLVATLSSKPKVAIARILLQKPVPVPAHVKLRLGLSGRWLIAAGTYAVKEKRIHMQLVRAR